MAAAIIDQALSLFQSLLQIEENDIEWNNLSSSSYCWFDNNQAVYGDTYGALYNWYAVNTAKLPPIGWHIPSEEEWRILEGYLGMTEEQTDIFYMRGEGMGTKLKSAYDWELDKENKSKKFAC